MSEGMLCGKHPAEVTNNYTGLAVVSPNDHGNSPCLSDACTHLRFATLVAGIPANLLYIQLICCLTANLNTALHNTAC
jgi:hypothetical protein